MSRQFRSDDTVKWQYGFGKGAYDATIGNETHGWDGSTRFQAQGVISGTAGQTSFVKPAGWGHRGLCLLHQTRGVGAGNWELAWVDFTGASAVSDKPLQNTYTTSGASAAQIITLSNGNAGYKNVNITGTLSAPAWNGSTGGILAILAKGTVTITGTLSANGNAGGLNTVNAGIGFSGGVGNYNQGQANSGESSTGAGSASSSANGTGGGGASGDDYSGGGGGHATNGIIGQSGGGGGGVRGAAGGTGGNAGLTNMIFGGAGGGGAEYDTSRKLSGAGGGGIVFIIAQNITISGSISSNGGTALSSESYGHGAGSGAGGSILIKTVDATLGTNLITAVGGANIMQRNIEGTLSYGGGGGAGRIHIDYSGSYSGSSNPAIDARQDLTIKPKKLGGGMLYSNFL